MKDERTWWLSGSVVLAAEEVAELRVTPRVTDAESQKRLAAMPKYYEGKEEDKRACSGVREDLKSCLLECPCVIKVAGVAAGRGSSRRRLGSRGNGAAG